MHRYCFNLNWEGMSSEAWAAWVQAVLTVITFAVALWFQSRDRKNAREDARVLDQRNREEQELQRRLEARAVAASILTDLVEFDNAAQYLATTDLRDRSKAQLLHSWILDDNRLQALLGTLSLTPILLSAAIPTQALIREILLLRAWRTHANIGLNISDENAEMLKDWLTTSRKHCTKARSEIEELFRA